MNESEPTTLPPAYWIGRSRFGVSTPLISPHTQTGTSHVTTITIVGCKMLWIKTSRSSCQPFSSLSAASSAQGNLLVVATIATDTDETVGENPARFFSLQVPDWRSSTPRSGSEPLALNATAASSAHAATFATLRSRPLRL